MHWYNGSSPSPGVVLRPGRFTDPRSLAQESALAEARVACVEGIQKDSTSPFLEAGSGVHVKSKCEVSAWCVGSWLCRSTKTQWAQRDCSCCNRVLHLRFAGNAMTAFTR